MGPGHDVEERPETPDQPAGQVEREQPRAPPFTPGSTGGPVSGGSVPLISASTNRAAADADKDAWPTTFRAFVEDRLAVLDACRANVNATLQGGEPPQSST